jgi:hypothetical protein
MYGGYGYGGIPPTGYGMGAPMHPGGFQQQGRYMFSRQMIDMQARSTFMKYDYNRNGVLGFREVFGAVNEFCAINGQMPVMQDELMGLFAMFDIDGSGQIDFFEYKMLLEQLGGLNTYDRGMLMGLRGQRGYHLQQYNGFW